TDVDGIYSADPKKDRNAKRYDRLTHQEAIERNLKVMDSTAFALARENRMPIIVFSIREKEAIAAVLRGKRRATVVGTSGAVALRVTRNANDAGSTNLFEGSPWQIRRMTSTNSSAACKVQSSC